MSLSFLRSPALQARLAVALLALVLVFVLSGVVWSHKSVVLKVDGEVQSLRTSAETVGDLLEENGVVLRPGDQVKPDLKTPLKDGDTVEIVKLKPIVVVVDGKQEQLDLAAHRVFQVIEKLGIKLKKGDVVYPSLAALVKPSMRVVVSRYQERLCQVSKLIPFSVEKHKDRKLLKGKKKVEKAGVKGKEILVYKYVYQGGRLIKRELVSEKTVKRPVNQVVAYGVASSRSYSARQPVRVSRGSSGRWLTMSATAYVPGRGCGYYTATGARARRGIVAVDPRVIPLGTHLYIPGYGRAVAADTGGSIKGYRIDLCFNSFSEARSFGRRQVRVQILD